MNQPDCSPSAERNKQPILEVMQGFMPPSGHALEIASGTGQHAQWFASQLPQWTWQPSDVHQGALYNIAARVAQAELDNLLEPMLLDARQLPWFETGAEQPAFDLIFCANMLHIAPWEACAALMQGAATYLKHDGRLVTYGPYFETDVPTAPSNTAFDASLRNHDAGWGIRQRADVEQEAARAGLQLTARHAMPANNLLLVWQRST